MSVKMSAMEKADILGLHKYGRSVARFRHSLGADETTGTGQNYRPHLGNNL